MFVARKHPETPTAMSNPNTPSPRTPAVPDGYLSQERLAQLPESVRLALEKHNESARQIDPSKLASPVVARASRGEDE